MKLTIYGNKSAIFCHILKYVLIEVCSVWL